MTSAIVPFRATVEKECLKDLQRRLSLIRWPSSECVSDWSQGVPLDWLKTFCGYWKDEYDFQGLEKRLNRYPQYKTRIEGVDIHFLHIRSSHEDAVPLLVTHGWPGSVLEFYRCIQPLVDPTGHGGTSQQAFHLVIPSLPGFGFSGKPTAQGWSVEKIASAWAELMERLGYEQYLAQGGDWGSGVTSAIGVLNPSACRGIHINLVVPPVPTDTSDLSDDEKRALEKLNFYDQHDSGYSKLQSTRPQTIGYALNDSPVALAAWITEKFHYWVDRSQSDQPVDNEWLVDNLMLYWLTQSGVSSARLYWESFSSLFDQTPITMPSGVSIYPKEIITSSKRWAQQRYQNLCYWNTLERGGHFAALEQPQLYVSEIRAFSDIVRSLP